MQEDYSYHSLTTYLLLTTTEEIFSFDFSAFVYI
jgi:hypothetical protein